MEVISRISNKTSIDLENNPREINLVPKFQFLAVHNSNPREFRNENFKISISPWIRTLWIQIETVCLGMWYVLRYNGNTI